MLGNSPFVSQFGAYNPNPTYAPTNAAVNAMFNNALAQQAPTQSQPTYVPSSINWVSGIESVNSCVFQPGQSGVFFDQNKPLMYVKSADASGFCTTKTYKIVEQDEAEEPKYVTQAEFEKFKAEMTKKKESSSK